MKIFLDKKYILPFFIFAFFCPLVSGAAGLSYGKIIYQADNSFILQYGNLGNADFYNCVVGSLSCADIGKNLPALPAKQTAGALPHFSFSTTSIWKKNIHTRIFYLKNNTTGKIYTRSYRAPFWDALGDEGTIAAFSSDDKKMVYQDDASGYPVLYQLDLTKLGGKTFQGKKIFAKSFSISGFIFASANELYFISNKDDPYQWNLYKYDFTKQNATLIAENASYAFKIRKFGNGFVFFIIQGASSFPVFYNPTTNQTQKFSGLASDDSPIAVNSQVISFGGNLHGVLVAPLDFDPEMPHQLVIWLHGGPYRQTSLGFHPYESYAVYDLILNELGKNNALVLKLDYRGSYGFGAEYTEAIKGNVGKGDVADVLTALAQIKKDDNISETYLMGNSYGGYLALRSLMASPEKFAGAISINGVTDWASLVKTLRDSIFNADFGGLPNKKNAKLYAQASILSRISVLTDQKIILIQSQADKTISPAQADLLYQALKNKNKNVELYPYPNEDHTFTNLDDVEGICRNVFIALSLSPNNNCNFH